jgi:putative DNA methylase
MSNYKRKLIEVALPLEAINKESAREKSIRHGHPSTLHLWWARRPLAACRAVLFASLVDDPSAHPERFQDEAAQEKERQRLFLLMEELVKWDNSTNERVLSAARAEIELSCDGKPPPLVDPFCGGGSIPLEAQRLGLEVHASDLNPVAVLITKALTEFPQRFSGRSPVNPSMALRLLNSWTGAAGLAEDIAHYGQWVHDEAERRIGSLYPRAKLPPEQGGGEAAIIAWIWARTVKSPNPAWNGQMPLVRSFALSTKPGREAWIDPIVDRTAQEIRYEVRSGTGWPDGTVSRSGAICLATKTAVPFEYVRTEARAHRLGAQLMAIIAEGPNGRVYLPATDDQIAAAASARPPADVPDTDLPKQALSFRVQAYGMTKHRNLFTDRQLTAITTFSDLVIEVRKHVLRDALAAGMSADRRGLEDGGTGAQAYADTVVTFLGLALSRSTSMWSNLCWWQVSGGFVAQVFTRQALAMVWDYAEVCPFSQSTGNWTSAVDWIRKVLPGLPVGPAGVVSQRDARTANPIERKALVSTDPPYYDNVGYADLSDFYYVWQRRTLGAILPDLFGTVLTPKSDELIATPYRFGGSDKKAKDFFEKGLRQAFSELNNQSLPDFPITVFYAFKQEEHSVDGAGLTVSTSTGWETMLGALLGEGLEVRGTWPMRTERPTGVKTNVNALAGSVVLVCRRRSLSAALGTRKEFMSTLKGELPDALRRLQQGNIAPVDLAQAAIGPGMAVFSRYAKVIEADGSTMSIRAALGIINQLLDETLARQEGDFDPDTRWAVAWFEQFAMRAGDYGVAETLSKAKNSAVNGLVEAGIVEAHSGKVRLLERDELPAEWDPAADRRLTVWEVTQHLVRALETGGEGAAAELAGRVGGLAETARELAYRLYNICERKRWAKEALSYNGLVVAWPGILRVGAEQSGQAVQMSLGG